MNRSIVELLFAMQGHAGFFTAKSQGKFLPAASNKGFCSESLFFALRFFSLLPFASPRFGCGYFMETAIAGLEAEIDLFDGSDQIATQCVGLGLGAVAQQALAELGMSLGSEPPQAAVEWVERELCIHPCQCVAVLACGQQGVDVAILQGTVARVGFAGCAVTLYGKLRVAAGERRISRQLQNHWVGVLAGE